MWRACPKTTLLVVVNHESQSWNVTPISASVNMGKVLTSDAQRFMEECLKAAGAALKPAKQQAELLIMADKMGHPSHGMNRLGE